MIDFSATFSVDEIALHNRITLHSGAPSLRTVSTILQSLLKAATII